VLDNSSVPSESLANRRSHTSGAVLPAPRGFDATSGSKPESLGSTGSIGERTGRTGLVFGGAVAARGVVSVGAAAGADGAADGADGTAAGADGATGLTAGETVGFAGAFSVAADAAGVAGFDSRGGEALGD
jgi:hypothetical protein